MNFFHWSLNWIKHEHLYSERSDSDEILTQKNTSTVTPSSAMKLLKYRKTWKRTTRTISAAENLSADIAKIYVMISKEAVHISDLMIQTLLHFDMLHFDMIPFTLFIQ